MVKNMHLHISETVYLISHPVEIVECYWLFNKGYACYDRAETGEFSPEDSLRNQNAAPLRKIKDSNHKSDSRGVENLT